MSIEEELEAELKIITSDKYFYDFFRVKYINEFLEENKLNLLSVFEEFLNEKYPDIKDKHIIGHWTNSDKTLNPLRLLRPFVISYYDNDKNGFKNFLTSFDSFITENNTDICNVIYVHGIELEQYYQKLEHIEFVKLFDLEHISNNSGGISHKYNGYFPHRLTSRYHRFKNSNPLEKLNINKLPSFAIRISKGISRDIFSDEQKFIDGGTVLFRWLNQHLNIDMFQIINLITNNCVASSGHYDDLKSDFCPIQENSWGQTNNHDKFSGRFRNDFSEKLDINKLEETLNLYANFLIKHCPDYKPDKLMDLVNLAMRRFFLAKLEDNQQDKLINFCICLEALLTNEGNSQEVSLKFSLNGAWFLADKRDKEKTWKFLQDVYKMRSNIVHGCNPKKLHEIDFKELQAITAEVILKYLTLDEVPKFHKLRLGL